MTHCSHLLSLLHNILHCQIFLSSLNIKILEIAVLRYRTMYHILYSMVATIYLYKTNYNDELRRCVQYTFPSVPEPPSGSASVPHEESAFLPATVCHAH